MRKRILFTVICLIATLFLFLNGYGLWQILQNYIHSQEEKVREWQREHQTFDDDLPAPVTSTFPPRPVEIEWVTQDPSTSTWAPSTTRIPVATTTTRIRITTSSKATSTYSISESTSTTTTSSTEAPSTTTTWEPSTEAPITWPPITTSTVTFEPSTEASTFSSSTTTWEPSTSSTEAFTTTSTPSPTTTTSSSTTSSTTTTTTVPPETSTTARIRTWTYPTRRPPPIFDPERHRYGQDRLHHHHHHHHHTSTTSTTSSTTTTTTETPSTTTRILVTTPRYPASQSNSIYDRITIPASSSYRNPYIHKIEVTSSTYRTPDRHHHHHHHNRTHIDIHSHHRHHLGYPQFPYPVIPSVLYPTTSTSTSTKPSTSTTTTSEAPEAPETTTHRHHHHHHHHHHSTTTAKPTTTTTRQSELDRWGFVESVEEVASEEEASSTTTSTTTTTEAPTTTTTAPPEPVTMTPRGRHRQPEPTQAPTKRVERDVTLVTGFLDIGRGEWDIYRRPLETYHKFMETLLTLENNFVVFTDESSYDFVIRTRTKLNLIDKTKVYKITLQDLPLYSYINEARKIIDDELKNETFYRTVADLDMKTHPESISAEYNIVVNSKTHFLHNVTMENPFDSEHFVWLDAGYGHANENYFPYSYNWRPALPDGKISLIKVTPYFDAVGNYDLKKLYRKNVALLSGGFIAGDKHSIGQLHSIIHRKFIQLIYQNHVDDDQTLLTLAVNSYPHLFHIVLGDWFDAFRLFASDPEVQMG